VRADDPAAGNDHLPRLPAAYVPRPRLWSALDAAVEGAVTVLAGPSGSGKTLGVAGWVRGRPDAATTTWLRADEATAPTHLESLLRGDRLLVIDDAQNLSHACIQALDRRLDLEPDRMRVVLLSAWDLPFTRLASELLGQLTVLRGDLLRLDEEESVALVRAHVVRQQASPELSSELARTNNLHARGWCAVVVLAARAVAGSPDPLALARSYVEGGSSLADRVASEVLSRMTPQQRHLLLCVSSEPSVSAQTARELTNDPLAPETLDELKGTGLLVTRLPDDEAPDASPRYAVHPLLAEVVRRRVEAGGVDVARAASTVSRAVRADVARHTTHRALQRLIGLRADDAVVDLLEKTGLRLVLAGHALGLREWVHRHTDLVDQRPSIWLAVGLERWVAGDLNEALGWLGRTAGSEAVYPGSESRRAIARLIRAMIGLEPLHDAIVSGERAVANLTPGDDGAAVILRAKLGAAHGWVGHPDRAVAHLDEAAQLCRIGDLVDALPGVLADLAIVHYTRGQEFTAGSIAVEARGILDSRGQPAPIVTARLGMLEAVVAASDLPAEPGSWHPVSEHLVPKADVLLRFWYHLARARRALFGGSVVTAARILAEPASLPPAPRALRVALETERALVAGIAGALFALAQQSDRVLVRSRWG